MKDNDNDDYVKFDIDNCEFRDDDDEYLSKLASQIRVGNGDLTPYGDKDRDERFPILKWRKHWNETHGITESSGSYNGQRLTFKQIIKYERMHGRIIPDDALKELLRRKRIFPTNDHTYSKSVLTTIARNRAELNDIINALNGAKNNERIPSGSTEPKREYAPRKGISKASRELLKGDDIAYNGEKTEESKNMRKRYLVRLTESDLHRIVRESVNRILSENAHDYWGDAEDDYLMRERLPKGWEKIEREDDEPMYRDADYEN